MQENLTFNVAQLLKEATGATRSGVVVADLHRLVPDVLQAEDRDEAGLSGPVRLMHSQGGVLVQAQLRGEAVLLCARCVEPVAVPLDVCIEETFRSTLDIVTGKALAVEEEDRALWIDEHHMLNLEEVLRQSVLVTVPMHVVCRENCRGLCPTCGQNLNTGSCDCGPEPDPRWSALLDLLKEPS